MPADLLDPMNQEELNASRLLASSLINPEAAACEPLNAPFAGAVLDRLCTYQT